MVTNPQIMQFNADVKLLEVTVIKILIFWFLIPSTSRLMKVVMVMSDSDDIIHFLLTTRRVCCFANNNNYYYYDSFKLLGTYA